MNNDEINRAVHEAKGHCNHNYTFYPAGTSDNREYWQCEKCPCRVYSHLAMDEYKRNPTPSYTTDPRYGEPLEDELLEKGFTITKDSGIYIFNRHSRYAGHGILVNDKIRGRARSIAWLKMHQKEVGV